MASESKFREWIATAHGQSVKANAIDVALKIKARQAKLGISGVVDVVRYNRIVAGKDAAGFTVCNTWNPLLAREIMNEVPELQGFFVTHEMPALKP